MLEKYILNTQEYFQKKTQENSKYTKDHKERRMARKLSVNTLVTVF